MTHRHLYQIVRDRPQARIDELDLEQPARFQP